MSDPLSKDELIKHARGAEKTMREQGAPLHEGGIVIFIGDSPEVRDAQGTMLERSNGPVIDRRDDTTTPDIEPGEVIMQFWPLERIRHVFREAPADCFKPVEPMWTRVFALTDGGTVFFRLKPQS